VLNTISGVHFFSSYVVESGRHRIWIYRV
jgi:hypothetical protein